MDNRSKGKAQGWYEPPPLCVLAGSQNKLHEDGPLGLRGVETRQLSSSSKHSEGRKICNKRQRVCLPQHKRGGVLTIESLKKEYRLRNGGKEPKVRHVFGGLRRTTSCYSAQALKDSSRLSTILEKEEKEDLWIESDSMDGSSYPLSSSGFSDPGNLVEQEPWFPSEEDFQTTTVMAMGQNQPWEDVDDDVFEEVL